MSALAMGYDFLCRSMFYVPCHIDKYFDKLRSLDADIIILDLEDAVPHFEKSKARANLKAFLHSEEANLYKIIVRINELEARCLLDDLDASLCAAVYGLMPSKIRTSDELFVIASLLSQYEKKLGLSDGYFKLIPLIETLSAFCNLETLVSGSPRLSGLAFGGEDYLKELGGKHGIDDHTFDYPRTRIAIAAKSAGLQAIDTPYLDVDDLSGFAERERKSRDLGYDGCLLIHPKQIELANSAFSPSAQEIQDAERLHQAVKDSEKAGLSVAVVDGVLIGPPMMKQAIGVLRKRDLINAR